MCMRRCSVIPKGLLRQNFEGLLLIPGEFTPHTFYYSWGDRSFYYSPHILSNYSPHYFRISKDFSLFLGRSSLEPDSKNASFECGNRAVYEGCSRASSMVNRTAMYIYIYMYSLYYIILSSKV